MKEVFKEVAGGLAVCFAVVVCFWLVVFGPPKKVEASPEVRTRVSAGIGNLTMGSGWADRLKEKELADQRNEREARRRKAPAGVPQNIWDICREYETAHISAYILAGVAKVESDFNPRCITGKCYGLMQVHEVWEFDRFRRSETWDSPRASVRVCAEILEEHWQRYKSVRKALQVYNQGWAGAKYDRTSYSDKVIRFAEKYKEEHKQ